MELRNCRLAHRRRAVYNYAGHSLRVAARVSLLRRHFGIRVVDGRQVIFGPSTAPVHPNNFIFVRVDNEGMWNREGISDGLSARNNHDNKKIAYFSQVQRLLSEVIGKEEKEKCRNKKLFF